MSGFVNARIVKAGADPEEYHTQSAERGSAAFVVSASMLSEFSVCPQRWKMGYVSPESKSKRFGSILDCLLLCPEAFERRYAVKPSTYMDENTGEVKKWNGNANACKKWLSENQSLEPVTEEEMRGVSGAVARIKYDAMLRQLVECSAKQVRMEADYHDGITGLSIPVKALVDLLPETGSDYGHSMADVKTSVTAHPNRWARIVHQYRYHIQGAFYLDMHRAATGEERTNWLHLVVENFPPYQTARHILSQEFLEIGRHLYKMALQRYAYCLKSGSWPGYEWTKNLFGWNLIEPDAWMINALPDLPETSAVL